MPRRIVRTNPSNRGIRYIPRTNPSSAMIQADQLRPGDVIDMEDLGREHVIQGPYRDGKGIRFVDLYGNSVRLRPKEVVRLVMRENPRRKSQPRRRRNPELSMGSPVVALQQDVAAILDRANALPPTARFRVTSNGGLEIKSIWLAEQFYADQKLFNRLSTAAARYGFDNIPSGTGLIMLPFGKRVYTHRHVDELFENPRNARSTRSTHQTRSTKKRKRARR